MYIRYSTHLYAYLLLAANPYPGFGGRARLPGRRSRSTVPTAPEPLDDRVPPDPRASGAPHRGGAPRHARRRRRRGRSRRRKRTGRSRPSTSGIAFAGRVPRLVRLPRPRAGCRTGSATSSSTRCATTAQALALPLHPHRPLPDDATRSTRPPPEPPPPQPVRIRDRRRPPPLAAHGALPAPAHVPAPRVAHPLGNRRVLLARDPQLVRHARHGPLAVRRSTASSRPTCATRPTSTRSSSWSRIRSRASPGARAATRSTSRSTARSASIAWMTAASGSSSRFRRSSSSSRAPAACSSSSRLLGWFASLALGRMPLGLRNAGAFVLRYEAQVNALRVLPPDRPLPVQRPGRAARRRPAGAESRAGPHEPAPALRRLARDPLGLVVLVVAAAVAWIVAALYLWRTPTSRRDLRLPELDAADYLTGARAPRGGARTRRVVRLLYVGSLAHDPRSSSPSTPGAAPASCASRRPGRSAPGCSSRCSASRSSG